MISAVTPTSNGFGGGTYAPAGRPTGVSGPFSSPGATAATPPGVPSSGIIEARNNRGSNVQIPYARLVPMHARDNNHSDRTKDPRYLMVNGHSQLEYDGLHQGELAWILGRRFANTSPDGISDVSVSQRYAHQAIGGLGNGVDRMQRLASTGWMEQLFFEKLGSTQIELHKIKLDSAYAKAMDASLNQYSEFLAGGFALNAPDVTYNKGLTFGDTMDNVIGKQRSQGINAFSMSPFLRGKQVDSKVVRFESKRGSKTVVHPDDLPRNLGDNLAFAALELELRKKYMMDWTPDGVVLSKLESPTDEPMKSTELDARQAQLFNIGVQGPAITTAWTSDVRDYKLEVQPLDKVFMVVVADLAYTVCTGEDKAKFDTLAAARNAVFTALQKRDNAKVANNASELAKAESELKAAIADAKNASTAFETAVDVAKYRPEYLDISKDYTKARDDYLAAMRANNDKADLEAKKAAFATAETEMNEYMKFDENSKNTLEELQKEERAEKSVVAQAVLTNFRLKRETSSHMSNYSFYKESNTEVNNSRLGLKLGKHIEKNVTTHGVRTVVVGGWCIGTVVDSAASRSTVGFQTVKTHPTSMAINLNVNVQWWSGDKMHKHYMDQGGQVLQRGQKRDREDDDPSEQDVELSKTSSASTPSSVQRQKTVVNNDLDASASAFSAASRSVGGSSRRA